MPIFFRQMNNLETAWIIRECFYYHFLKMCAFTTNSKISSLCTLSTIPRNYTVVQTVTHCYRQTHLAIWLSLWAWYPISRGTPVQIPCDHELWGQVFPSGYPDVNKLVMSLSSCVTLTVWHVNSRLTCPADPLVWLHGSSSSLLHHGGAL